MRTFILPDTFNGEREVSLSGKDSHYLCRVLRMKIGQSFAGMDKNGKTWDLKIIAKDAKSCRLACASSLSVDSVYKETLPMLDRPLPNICLYIGLCKGKKMDTVVRQATEIGVSKIIPVKTQHSMVEWSEKASAKANRFEVIVKEALQQCGSRIPTIISEPIMFADLVAHWRSRGPALAFHESSTDDQLPLFSVLDSIAPNDEIAIAIGPEGGFSLEEIEIMKKACFSIVHLKTNILRSETAVVYALGAVQTYLMEHR